MGEVMVYLGDNDHPSFRVGIAPGYTVKKLKELLNGLTWEDKHLTEYNLSFVFNDKTTQLDPRVFTTDKYDMATFVNHQKLLHGSTMRVTK